MRQNHDGKTSLPALIMQHCYQRKRQRSRLCSASTRMPIRLISLSRCHDGSCHVQEASPVLAYSFVHGSHGAIDVVADQGSDHDAFAIADADVPASRQPVRQPFRPTCLP